MATPPIKLIVGLGNPGNDYEATRHNTGFWFVDRLAQRHNQLFKTDSRHHGAICKLSIHGQECRLLKPTTFMNRSGQSVSSLANYFRITPEEILVAHDELDLLSGEIRLKTGGGHAGHNGLRDIMSALGSREFHRLRIGIDQPNRRGPGVDFVLGRPSKVEREAIMDGIDRAIDCMEEVISGRLQQAMNQLHTRR
ncbi:MAG: aminoacyl-tRNA hydrolase [Candidatus Thiodiazotropha sp. (ex Monitilora ramsayi)]|nr:aminoacyl-tRNA hydrolase [Candidatus Thiodiazotropha sp. (ex Monitilora ramsayi)]